MKKSRYIFVKKVENNYYGYYNLFNRALIYLSSKQNEVAKLLLNETSSDSMSSEIYNSYEVNQLRNMLIKEGYLISEEFDEREVLLTRHNLTVYNKTKVTYTILPTLDCNFACPYCFEKVSSEYPTMVDLKDRFLAMLEKQIVSDKLTHIDIAWYGGEPLLEAYEIIDSATSINQLCSARNVSIRQIMTTNGYLLTRDLAVKLIEQGINRYQITLDGTKEYHNKTRPLKSKHISNTFDTIFTNIRNIVQITDYVYIIIRMNVTKSNYSGISDLIDLLSEDPVISKHKNQISINLEAVAPIGEAKYTLSPTECVDIFNNEDILPVLELKWKADNLGFDVGAGGNLRDKMRNRTTEYCEYDHYNCFSIDPMGNLYKCATCAHPDFDPDAHGHVGKIDENGNIILKHNEMAKWMNKFDRSSQCFNCKYLPMCFGGCSLRRFQYGDQGKCIPGKEIVVDNIIELMYKKHVRA